MPELSDIVGGLLAQIARGRSQADAASLEVASAYKDHPLLATFPVPRVTLDEVVVELKLAIASPPGQGALPLGARDALVGRVAPALAEAVRSDPDFRDLAKQFPAVEKAWRAAEPELRRKLDAVVPRSGDVEPQALARALTAATKEVLANVVLQRATKVSLTAARAFHLDEAARLEQRLLARATAEVAAAGAIAPPGPRQDRFEVIVDAASLQAIPPERISTLRFTIREADRTWMKIEDEQGQQQARLVPG